MLDVDHHAVQAHLRGVGLLPTAFKDKRGLQQALQGNKIAYGLDVEAIVGVLKKLGGGTLKVDECVLIAQGRRAEPGRGGSVEFEVSISDQAEFTAQDVESMSKVDYRNSVSFSTVNIDDVVARLVPPTDGQQGVSLSGKLLPTKPGKPARIKAGEGVKLAEDGIRFVATRQGRPALRKGQIRVLPVLDIPGDVDLATGNIKFDGHVIVAGHVQDASTVTCGSLHVRGSIGAAIVTVATDLRVDGGINGKGEAKVVVGGEARLGHVNAVDLEVKGRLAVKREIVGSTVRCEHRLTAMKIMGGDCTALLGVVCSELGSPMGVETSCYVGVHHKVRTLDRQLAGCEQKIEEAVEPLTAYFGERARFRALTDKRRAALEQRATLFGKLHALHERLSDTRRKIIASLALQPVPQVLVKHAVYSDVFVSSGRCSTQFSEVSKGKMVLEEALETRSMVRAERPHGPITRRPQQPNDGKVDTRPEGPAGPSFIERKLENHQTGIASLLDEQDWVFVVADPSGLTRRYTSDALKRVGCERVIEARDGAEAVAAIKAAKGGRCLVIADAALPGVSGLKLAAAVKAAQDLRRTRVFVVSSDTRKAKIVEALQAGAHDYLARPFHESVLVQKLSRQGALPIAWKPMVSDERHQSHEPAR